MNSKASLYVHKNEGVYCSLALSLCLVVYSQTPTYFIQNPTVNSLCIYSPRGHHRLLYSLLAHIFFLQLQTTFSSMASLHKSFSIFITFFLFSLFCCSCNAYNFNVGGKNGWTIPPSESYNQWAGRLRFNVNDTLHFKYNGGSDSVMVVNNGDYDNCNTNNPITTLTGGDSYYNLNHSGPFYFISGNKSNCDKGQKLIVVVISPKKIATPPAGSSPVPAMSPASSPESGIVMPGSPVGSPGEGVASSPTMNPADANAPAAVRGTSSAARLPICVTLVMMLIGLGWLN